MKKADLEQIKKTIIFIGRFRYNEKGQKRSALSGTGSLVNIEGINHVITAKHVVCELDGNGKIINEKEDLHFFVKNKKDDKVTAGSLRISDAKWFYHDNDEVDLVLIPIRLNQNLLDVESLPISMLIESRDVYETNEVFYISYQPDVSEIEKDNDISPIVRKGMISRVNKDDTYYIDGSAFPGNSGSPVYMLPAAARFTDEGITIGQDKLGGKLVGIIGAYIPYIDIAVSSQTKRPRITFEENTGLSKVWSVKQIKEIINKGNFKENLKLLKQQKL